MRWRIHAAIQIHPPRRPSYLVGYADEPLRGVRLCFRGPDFDFGATSPATVAAIIGPVASSIISLTTASTIKSMSRDHGEPGSSENGASENSAIRYDFSFSRPEAGIGTRKCRRPSASVLTRYGSCRQSLPRHSVIDAPIQWIIHLSLLALKSAAHVIYPCKHHQNPRVHPRISSRSDLRNKQLVNDLCHQLQSPKAPRT
jgi:hypothetical protein